MLRFCLAFCQFQPGVVYKCCLYKKACFSEMFWRNCNVKNNQKEVRNNKTPFSLINVLSEQLFWILGLKYLINTCEGPYFRKQCRQDHTTHQNMKSLIYIYIRRIITKVYSFFVFVFLKNTHMPKQTMPAFLCL